MSMSGPPAETLDQAIEELRDRLGHYSPERYPVQHATAQFHLGVGLTNAGLLDDAREALLAAARIFDERLPVEHAKATNALGAVLRQQGRLEEARQAFARAESSFADAGLTAERGAACFNLGLAQRDSGRAEQAAEAFHRARRLLEDSKAPAQAAAAARELGATLLGTGDLDGARRELERARKLSDHAGDTQGIGAAANMLGLTHLNAGRADEAVAALRAAVAANPRSLRPEAYAMAKANLALAHEQAGDELRARISARQALGVPSAAEPVARQAADVCERLGGGPEDLPALLDREPQERWRAIVGEELVRWVDAGASDRRAEAAAWIEGQLERPGAAVELADALLGALLELPPDDMEAIVRSVVEALTQRDEDTAGRVRTDVSMAMAHFHVPQMMRLQQTFEAASSALGHEASWR